MFDWLKLAVAFTKLVNIVATWLRERELIQAGADKAKAEAERDQAVAGRKAEEKIAEEASKPLGEDDAMARLERGDG